MPNLSLQEDFSSSEEIKIKDDLEIFLGEENIIVNSETNKDNSDKNFNEDVSLVPLFSSSFESEYINTGEKYSEDLKMSNKTAKTPGRTQLKGNYSDSLYRIDSIQKKVIRVNNALLKVFFNELLK